MDLDYLEVAYRPRGKAAMNYINQIKAFHDLNEAKPFATGQIALWYALMHINNKCYWQEWFSVSNQVLSLHTGLSRQGILKARNALKQEGIIDFKPKGTKSTQYRLVDLTSKSSQVGCQASSQAGCQAGCTIININNSDYGDEYIRVRETAGCLLEKYWGRRPTEADCEYVRNKIIRIDVTSRSVIVDEDKVELLEYAFKCSADACVHNWNYIAGVYERFNARGIACAGDAYGFDVRRDM